MRILTILDEYTQGHLGIVVERNTSSENVINGLSDLFLLRGIPKYIRWDNGPEFTAKLVRESLNRLGLETLFIEAGTPWENGYTESCNGKLRDELLDGEIFTTLLEAKILIRAWRNEYNQLRLQSSLGYRPPAPEAIQPIPVGAILT